MDDDLELLGSGVDPIAEQFETCVLLTSLICVTCQLQFVFLRADTRNIWTSRLLLLTSFTWRTCHWRGSLSSLGVYIRPEGSCLLLAATVLRLCQRPRYHGNGEVIRREEFAQRKQAAEDLQLARLNTKAKRLASAGKKFDGYPVLQVLH